MADLFVIEASLGGIRVKLSTVDDKSFSLKRSAEEIRVDFSCFTGELCLSCPSREEETRLISEEQLEAKEKSDLFAAQESASSLDVSYNFSSHSLPESEAAESERNERYRSAPVPAPTESEAVTKPTRRFHENVHESELLRFKEPIRTDLTLPESETRSDVNDGMMDSTIRRESALASSSMASKHDLCVRLKDSIDRYKLLGESSMTVASSLASELQLACARPKVSPRELKAILDADPQAAAETDAEGRFPLHILSENESLLSTFMGSKDAKDFCLSLFETFPEALIIRDGTGAFPFVHLIQNWVNDAYVYVDEVTANPRQGLVRTLRSRGKLTSLFGNESEEDAKGSHESSTRRARFPHVVLTRQAQVSLEILSSFLDRLNESYRQGGFDRDANMLVRAVLARSIADIPNLLKTVLLIDDTDKRHWVSCCSIIERVFFCYESTGDWVCNMIQRGSVPSRRAVDYLVEVSGLTAADYVGPGRSPRADDIEAYERDRKKVFAALEVSAPMIPSLTVLNNNEKGRAATTDAVWLILNHCLSSPLLVGFLLADFVFSVVLLQSFRYVSDTENMALYFGRESSPLERRHGYTLFLSVCIYFLLRKLGELYSLLKLSARAFRSYIRDFWNLIDVAAIALSLSAVLSQTSNPLFLALAIASLWMKLLGLLRAFNAHLATFILAILEIVKDIRWFLLVLAMAIFMFADVIHIITVHAHDGEYCSTNAAPDEFCEPGVGRVYLKLYAVLVGDVNLEDFEYSNGIEFLFVLFTLMGIIILLNILIAVVGDSYKKSVMNARYLFGRARVDFAVTFVAQEDLLKSSDMPEVTNCQSMFDGEHLAWYFGLFWRLVLWSFLLFTAAFSLHSLIRLASSSVETGEIIWWWFLTILFGVMLVVSITLVGGNMFERPLRHVATRLGLSGLVSVLDALRRTAELFARKTFGIGSPDSFKEAMEEDPRVKFLQETVIQVVSTAKDSLTRNIDAAEQRIKANASVVAEKFYASIESLST